jgi:uncharacterized protein (TIGR02678 family)
MRVAAEVGGFELPDYQRSVRLLLIEPLITESRPNAGALPLIRRWADQLRRDLPEVLGYTLEMTGTTARLRRAHDDLDATRPAITRAGRPFDRRRYAYLVLTMAALGRSGTQIALSEMADAVAADAGRIAGLGLDTERKADRDAFVDAVAWLETREAIRLADGSAADWANNPDRAEALYDIDRESVLAVYRPGRVLQHLRSVTALLDGTGRAPTQGQHTVRRAAARRARRMVLEQPAVYYDDVDESLRGQLRSPALIEDLERLTGLTVERRAEGLAIIDTSGRLSDTRFPGGGTVSQAALLIAGRIAAYVEDEGPVELPAPTARERREALAARIDAGLPARGVLTALSLAAEETPARDGEAEPVESPEAGTSRPFIPDSVLAGMMRRLMEIYGVAFGAVWRADPDRLLGAALDRLAALRLIIPVEGGVLALPLLARYRGVVAKVKPRAQESLFDIEEETP